MSEETNELSQSEVETKTKNWFDIYAEQIESDIEDPSLFSELSKEQKDEIVKRALDVLPINGDFSNISKMDEEKGHNPEDRFESLWYYESVDSWLIENFAQQMVPVYHGELRPDIDLTPLEIENYDGVNSSAVDDRMPGFDNTLGNEFAYVGPKYNANLYFQSALISLVNKVQSDYGEDAASNLARFEYLRYFHPACFMSAEEGAINEGFISDKIELLSLVKRKAAAYDNLYNLLCEDMFDIMLYNDKNESPALAFSGKSPIETIHLLEAESDVYHVVSRKPDDFLTDAFSSVIQNKETPPLVRLVAEDKLNTLTGKNIETSLPDDITKEQDNLHNRYPGFDKSDHLLMIAPDVCASDVGGKVNCIINSDGNKLDAYNINSDSMFNIDKNDMLLIQTSHDPGVKKQIESELGVTLNNISLDTQKYLLRFAMEAHNDRYDNLVRQLDHFEDESDKMQLIDAFLSVEFGDDFGDNILSIAEHAKSEESVEIFKIIKEYRETSKKFGQIYYDFSPDLAHSTEKAMNERLTDLLAIVDHVAINGSDTIDVSPRRSNEDYIDDGRFHIAINSVSEIIEVMQAFLKSQQILQDVLSDKNTRITKMAVENKDRISSQTYNLINSNKGFVQLHARERGSSSYDKSTEYGNSSGTEATISWLVNPINPYKKLFAKDSDAISTRFDREGRIPGEAPDSTDRSPIREQGIVSIDIGSVIGEDSLSVKLGRMIAAGNIIRSEKNGTGSSLNHNTNYFDQSYGNADNFEKLVDYIENKVETSYKPAAKEQLAKIALKLLAKSQNQERLAS